MEWHDSPSDVIESELVDVRPIMQAQSMTAAVKTSKGKLLFKKMLSPRHRAVMAKFGTLLAEMTQMQSRVLPLIDKPDEDKTIDDIALLADFMDKGRPYSEEMVFQSLFRPSMDRETFDAMLDTFDEAERQQIMLAVAGIYAPTEAEREAAKHLVQLASEYGIPPFPGVRSIEDATIEQLNIMQENSNDKNRALAKALKN
jgi:hypothetical protein